MEEAMKNSGESLGRYLDEDEAKKTRALLIEKGFLKS
jgi:hypothetical protein